MAEQEQNNKNDFIIEKIKDRPMNKKKLLRRTIITAVMAVIFGLIACFTFLVLEPVISNWLYPEEEPQVIVFPEDQEEMSPEEMLADNMQQENQTVPPPEPENVTLEEEQIQEILSGVTLNKNHYKQLYSAMSDYVTELSQYMVTVTGVTSNIDWFNNVQESKNQASGVIIANNGRELLVLADYTPIRQAEKLSLSFSNGVQVAAQLKQKESSSNLAVISVNLADLPPEMQNDNVSIVTLGSSNVKNLVGTPVVAMGSPMGISGSVGYGMITSVNNLQSAADRNYKLMLTDITGSQNAGGVLFNMQGQVIGILTSNKTGTDMKSLLNAIGITELKKIIEKMSNGSQVAYMGIKGVDVTREAHEDLAVPYGAYVTEIDMDSPAMLAGIQQGDVIVEIEDRNILTFSEYTTLLLQLNAGDTVHFTVMRQVQEEYKEMSFDIVLGESK